MRCDRVARDARHLNPADVTFVVLTLDEARNVPRALASVPPGAHVLVVDAQSRDDTVALARAAGAETIVAPWAGFVDTRRAALARVRTPWTFMLDADEALDAIARAALADVTPPASVDGYEIARATYFCGRPMRAGAWGREAPLRLFRTARATLAAHAVGGGDAQVHESWHVPGTVARLAGTLDHHSYPTLATYREKFARYTALEAAATRPSRLRLVRAIALGIARVPWTLVVRGGWRDGWRGAYVAVASACYPVAVAWRALRA